MNIALDYDGTYTLNSMFWSDFIELCKQEDSINLYIVTLRSLEHDAIENDNAGIPIIYCDGRPKADVVKERGIHIDIWIDDQPECIHYGSSFNTEQLAEWRKMQNK